MLCRVFAATALIALLTGGALAQDMNLMPQERRRSDEDVQRDKQIEQRYHETIKDLPDKPASKDPWGNVRSTPAAKAPATANKKQP